MHLIYNFISTIGLLLYLPRLLLKKGPENRSTFIRERLGRAAYSKTDIWVHAVSVGETLACIPFLKKLKKEFPDKTITLSTTTYTGQKIAREKFGEADRIMYMPLDSIFCVRRVVQALRPDLFITVETELWPSLFQSLKRVGARIIILNGRISNDSFKGYKKIKFMMQGLLSSVDFFYMQGEGDAERIIALGADKDRVDVMGNFKFDIDLKEDAPVAWLTGVRGEILLAASTHEGEEEILLDAFTRIKNGLSEVMLILAPRRPERFDAIAAMIKARGFSFIRRSEISEAGMLNGGGVDVILLDTIGELSRVFCRASVAFIGGSLIPHGGHNIMEPAYWAKPIIFGPHMDNFPIAKEFLKGSAAHEVKDAEEIATAVITLINDSTKALNMGQNAKSLVDKNTGAVKKALELVRRYLGTV